MNSLRVEMGTSRIETVLKQFAWNKR